MPDITRYASTDEYVASIPPAHLTGCSLGPTRCTYCRRQLAETVEEGCARIAAENRARNYPQARAACAKTPNEVPDPYAAAVAKLRGEHLDLTASDDPRHKANPNVPPDSYMLGIALRRAKAEVR
jgi:hypothetical protein